FFSFTGLHSLNFGFCIFIPDAASEDETCSGFQDLMKNGKLFCSQDKKLFQSPQGKLLFNKCVTCKMILEKEAKSQKRTGRLVKATAPTELNCSDFQKGEKDGDFICTADDAAVCGTDGKTYRNRCELCAENQKTSSQVGIKGEGKCESSNPEQVRTGVRVGESHGWVGGDLIEKVGAVLFLFGACLQGSKVILQCLSPG
uniref:Kazal-like domain-containing protein n=1 Tax=Urocitellus parryii TaxID=9999 RepID=A0A8D2KIV2_UROPR